MNALFPSEQAHITSSGLAHDIHIHTMRVLARDVYLSRERAHPSCALTAALPYLGSACSLLPMLRECNQRVREAEYSLDAARLNLGLCGWLNIAALWVCRGGRRGMWFRCVGGDWGFDDFRKFACYLVGNNWLVWRGEKKFIGLLLRWVDIRDRDSAILSEFAD